MSKIQPRGRFLVQEDEDTRQHKSLFHNRCTSHGKVCSLIIDLGSHINIISEEMVIKLGLSTKFHPYPYSIEVEDDDVLEVTRQCLVSFSIGKIYKDHIWCDVVKMDACHLLVERPWVFDRFAKYDEYFNTYSFTKDEHKIILVPLNPEEIAKSLKLNDDFVLTELQIIGPMNREKPLNVGPIKEEEHEVDLQVEDLPLKFDDDALKHPICVYHENDWFPLMEILEVACHPCVGEGVVGSPECRLTMTEVFETRYHLEAGDGAIVFQPCDCYGGNDGINLTGGKAPPPLRFSGSSGSADSMVSVDHALNRCYRGWQKPGMDKFLCLGAGRWYYTLGTRVICL
uniref:Uncharacterized protein LOC104227695 n=1 Tax=Nicotiana sylvestris TaxID=4096 RepID=A0A1U7WLY6_NICSY|nr:PREDICTED: uncharacterized protein LOC104227695 [Nicotiana sylvestris]